MCDFQSRDVAFSAWQCERLASCQQCSGEDGVAIGLAHLLPQTVHVRVEPHAEQDRYVDLARFGIGGRTIQKAGKIAEIRCEETDRSLMH
jgi:hypothetical protein